MIFLKLTLLAVFSLQTLAKPINKKNADLEAVREGNKIYLTGLKCRKIKNELRNLKKWAKQFTKLSEDVAEKIWDSDCECDEFYCKLDITNLSPELVKLYEDKRPDISGPNCWNNSLVTVGILPHYRYSTPEEMEFWMKSPLCRERRPNEKISPGDVVAIRDEKKDEYHGFVYISDNLGWSKNGFSNNSAYGIQDLKGVFDVYGVTKNCQRKYGMDTKCEKFANIYKCESWDKYWSKVDEKTKAKLDQDIEESLNYVECNISNFVFDEKTIDKNVTELIQNTIQILEYDILDKKAAMTKNTSEAERIYIDRAYYRILSIKEQLGHIEFRY